MLRVVVAVVMDELTLMWHGVQYQIQTDTPTPQQLTIAQRQGSCWSVNGSSPRKKVRVCLSAVLLRLLTVMVIVQLQRAQLPQLSSAGSGCAQLKS
jgi:hypothetical protein